MEAIVAMLFILVPMALLVAVFGFWIWMIIDCATKESSEGNDKLVWLLIIIFLNWIGALLYFFVRRQKRIQQFGV